MFLNPSPKGFSILAQPQMAMDAGIPTRRPRSSQTHSSSFDAAALMQRSDDDNYVWTSRRAVTHSHDSANAPSLSELRNLHSQIGEAHDSLGDMLKGGRFSFSGAQKLARGIADNANSLHGLLDDVPPAEDTEAKRDLEHDKARDSAGAVPAKSVVAPSGPSKVDHRKDFQGTDSALFDASCLFQRGA